jgi:Ca-activated chloride channel family protein
MSFIWPKMLFSLLLIPLVMAIYLRLLARRQAFASNLAPLSILQSGPGGEIGLRRHGPPMLYLLGLACLLFGMARPEMMVSLPRTEGTVILAFDVSNSMQAEDLSPNRLEAAKAAARTFIENQPSTIQVGVVAFSSGGLVVQQPTSDQAALFSTIDRLSPQGGTSLGHGIFSSLNAIAGEAIEIDETALEQGLPAIQIEDHPSAVVLLLTDGENTGRLDPLEIAQLAAEAGVRIYPIGIGSPEGSTIEVEGYNILTQLNEATLQEISSVTNGAYFRAEDEDRLQEIYKNVDLQLTVSGEMSEVTSIAAGASLLFLMIGGVLSLIWFGRAP